MHAVHSRSRAWVARLVALTLLVPTSYVADPPVVSRAAGAAASASLAPPAAVNPAPSMKDVTTPGPTVVSGTLSSDTVWAPSGSPYVVEGTFTVSQDVSLTLLPGTVVKFKGQSSRINVLGQILSLGTPQHHVVLTSHKDDATAGDTNGDGAATQPGRGDWSGILVYGNGTTSDSSKRPVSVFDYVDVRYGGYGAGSGCPTFGAVTAASSHARLVVANSTITDSLYAGVASGRVAQDGFVGIYDSYFASSRCGVTSVQSGDPGGQTEVVGNTFATDLDLASASFSYPRRTGFWFNTARSPLIAASGDYFDISVSYNQLLGGLGTSGAESQQLPDLRMNWWGDNLNNRPLPGPCMSYEASRAYQPPLATTASADCYVTGQNNVLVTGYLRTVLPALSAPPPDFLDAIAEPYAPRVGPVDTYRGGLAYEVEDLTIQDAGKTITASRSYRSDRVGGGDLGAGWRTSFSDGLSTDLDGVISLTLGDGSTIPFAQDDAAGYVPQRGVVADFSSDETGSVVTTPDDTTYTFDPSGLLTQMLLGDPGHAVDVDRSSEGTLSRVTGISGRYIDYLRDSSHLQRVADSTGRGLDFGFADDRLTSVTDDRGKIVETYRYGTGGRLTRVESASGIAKLAVDYDAQGRVSWLQQRGSARADIDYDSANGRRVITYADESTVDQYYDAYGRLVVEQTRGRSARHVVYDGFGRPVAEIPGIPSGAMEGYGPPAGATLYDLSGNPVLAVDPLGWATVTSFNGRHKPVRTTDPGGSTIVREYGPQGRVTSLTDPKGGVWTFTHAGDGQLRTVQDPIGRTREQTYEPDGDLATTTDETGATTSYGHDDLGRTTEVTGPRSNTWTIAYTSWDQPTTLTTPTGGVYHSSFNEDRVVRTVEDPLAKLTTYGYDTSGRVATVTVESPTTTPTLVAQFEYDALGRPTQVRDARGHLYTRDYTPEGWVATTSDPDGVTTTTAYDPAGRVWRVSDDVGAVTQRVFDRAGQVLKVQTPDGATETRTYDSTGNVASLTNGIGAKWSYEYDAFGQITTRTDPATKVLRLDYDQVGRLRKQTDEAGWETDYVYDVTGPRTVTATDGLGLVSEVKRNSTGQVISETDGRDAETAYTYNGDGTVATVTDAEGGVTSYSYDLAGNLTEVVDPADRAVSMAYDGLGLLRTRTYDDGTFEEFDYDATGNLIRRGDRNENDWTYAYTAGNRLATTTDPLAAVTEYAYDDLGRLKSVTDPTGVVAQTTYDPMGRTAVRSNTRDASWVTTYDLAGNVLTEKNPAGFTTVYTYDALSRLKTEQGGTFTKATYTYNNVGDLLTRVQGTQTLGWAYDGRHNVRAATDARGNTTAFEYDLAGNLRKTTRPTGQPSQWTYDLTGRMTTAQDGLGNTSHYGYNAAGDLTSVELPRGGQFAYTYDDVGRLASEKSPLSDAITYDYDGEGNVTTVSYPSGRTVTSRYDDGGNLATETAGGETRSYGYDDAGRLTSVTAPSGDIGFTYDDRGLLATGTDRFGTTTYAYDAAERLTSVALATGATTAYGYNSNNLLSTVRGPSNFNYAYDGFARLTGVTPVSPTVWGSEAYAYDVDGRVLKKSASNLELSGTYDASGQMASTTSTLGSVVNPEEGTATYTQDAAGRLKTRTLKVGTTTVSSAAYEWDADGNRTSVDTGNGPVTYDYDLADRLIGSTDGVTYDYDNDGNLTSIDRPGQADDATYVYNGFGELVGTTVGTQSATYERDGLGRVVKRTSSGGSDTYGYDGRSAALNVYDAASAPATSLIRTPDQDLVSLAPAGGTPLKATTNLHGDLSVLRSQANSSFPYSALFEPFGNAARTGSTPVPLGFQGMPQDTMSGLVDMGFRSYDSATARFTAEDDRVGHLDQGITLNRYQYGGAAPLDHLDPDGHDFLGINLNLNLDLPNLGQLLDGLGGVAGSVRSGLQRIGSTVRSAFAASGRAATSGLGSVAAHVRSAVTSLQGNLAPGAKSIGGSLAASFDHASSLAGSVSESDLSTIHTALDVAGFVPAIGDAVDGANAVLYLLEGDTANALISFAAMIPVIGVAALGARLEWKSGSRLSRLAHAPRTGRILYRGDSRSPEKIFRSGFHAKGGDASYEDFVLRNRTSRWVSTSESVRVARSFSAHLKEAGYRGWVYEIADPGGGMVARRLLSLPWLYRKELEVSFDGHIPPQFIRSARPTHFGDWSGPSVSNPGFGIWDEG